METAVIYDFKYICIYIVIQSFVIMTEPWDREFMECWILFARVYILIELGNGHVG